MARIIAEHDWMARIIAEHNWMARIKVLGV